MKEAQYINLVDLYCQKSVCVCVFVLAISGSLHYITEALAGDFLRVKHYHLGVSCFGDIFLCLPCFLLSRRSSGNDSNWTHFHYLIEPLSRGKKQPKKGWLPMKKTSAKNPARQRKLSDFGNLTEMLPPEWHSCSSFDFGSLITLHKHCQSWLSIIQILFADRSAAWQTLILTYSQINLSLNETTEQKLVWE